MKVNTLYIIGNGFDVAHKMPTKYWDFREWLVNKADQLDTDEELKSRINILVCLIDGCEQRAKQKSAQEAENVWGNWSQLEEYCGEIRLSQGNIDLMDRSWFDEDGEEHDLPYSSEEKGEEVNQFISTVNFLNVLFAQWVDSLSCMEAMEKAAEYKMDYFTKALKGKDYKVLNFNYTDTLEMVYGVDADNICHIHGKHSMDAKYYFGHGKEMPPLNVTKGLSGYIRYYAEKLSGEEGDFYPNVQISKSLFKDTQKAMQEHEAFFNELSEIKEVYVYGFSFGDVDMPYIRKIHSIAPSAVWNIYQYKQKEVSDEVKQKLYSLDKNIVIKMFRP